MSNDIVRELCCRWPRHRKVAHINDIYCRLPRAATAKYCMCKLYSLCVYMHFEYFTQGCARVLVLVDKWRHQTQNKVAGTRNNGTNLRSVFLLLLLWVFGNVNILIIRHSACALASDRCAAVSGATHACADLLSPKCKCKWQT